MFKCSRVCLCMLINVCASGVFGEELQLFINKCEARGIAAKSQKGFEKRCLVEVPATIELEAIPPSGDIEIEITLKGRVIDGSSIAQVVKERQIVSIDFSECLLTHSGFDAIREKSPNRLGFTKSGLHMDFEKGKSEPNTRITDVFEISIKDCESRVVDQVQRSLGFAKRTTIDMPQSYVITLNEKYKEVEQLVINGCSIAVQNGFVEESQASEVTLFKTKLSGESISLLLRLKRLTAISIYNYEIDETEWSKFNLPAKCADGLVVLTSGRLLEYLKKNLGSEVDLPGRTRLAK